MMDFGRFRYKTDDDIIVVMDDPVIENEEKKQDKDNQDLLEKLENAIESIENVIESINNVEKKPEKKPSIKVINEDYQNKGLMNKYLKGKGIFTLSDIDEEEQIITIKEEENLLKKYALDKERIEPVKKEVEIKPDYREEEEEEKVEEIKVITEEPKTEAVQEEIEEEPKIEAIQEEIEEETSKEEIREMIEDAEEVIVEIKEKEPKVINEDYHNKELMKKYLKGKGYFKKAIYEEEQKQTVIKKNEDLLVKYALDKEAIKPEVVRNKHVEVETVDIPVEKEPLLEKVCLIEEEREEMTPVELTDDINAPILPEPASLTEIVENTFKVENFEYEEEKVEINEVFKEPTSIKTKVKKLGPLGPLAVIFAFIVLGVTGTMYVYNSTNKVIVNKALSHVKGYSKYLGNSLSFDETGELSLLGDIIFISNDIEEDINDAKIKYDFKKTEKKRTLDLGLYKNERLNLATKINLSNNKGYILFEDLYDKYIQLSNYSYSNEQLKDGELESLTSYFITNFVKNIDRKKYKSENAKIIIDGKNVSVKKTNLSLTDVDVAEAYNATIDDIISSSYYSSILRKIVKEDIKIDVESLDSENIKTYDISFYSSKLLGKIKGIDVNVKYMIKKQICEFNIDNLIENNPQKCDKTKIEQKEFSIAYRLGENNKFTIHDSEGEVINGEIIESEDEILVNLGDENYTNIGHAKIYKIGEENIIDFALSQGTDKLVLSFKYEIDEVKVNSEYNININLDIETMDYTREKKTLSVNTILSIKNKVDKNQDYVSEYVSSEDLTSNEVKSIRSQIEEKVNNIFGRLEEE